MESIASNDEVVDGEGGGAAARDDRRGTTGGAWRWTTMLQGGGGGDYGASEAEDEGSSDDDVAVFRPVALPRPPQRVVEPVPERPQARSSPPKGGGGARKRSDPVIYHLDGALDMLNSVLVGMGGGAISHDVAEVEPTGGEDAEEAVARRAARVERRIQRRTQVQPVDRLFAAVEP